MARLQWLRRIPPVACLVMLAIACGQQPVEPLPTDSQAPDFSLPDVNPNSATQGQFLSPRMQLGNVSAWYFGHAT